MLLAVLSAMLELSWSSPASAYTTFTLNRVCSCGSCCPRVRCMITALCRAMTMYTANVTDMMLRLVIASRSPAARAGSSSSDSGVADRAEVPSIT